MKDNNLDSFNIKLKRAKNKWLKGKTKLSHVVDDLISEYKLITSPNKDLVIDNYYESKISDLEIEISERIHKYFPKSEREKEFYLGDKGRFTSDLFIQEEINTEDHVNFIIEIKQSNFFNKEWIYRFKELESILRVKENPFFIIVSNALPKEIDRFGQVGGIIVCKPEEIINAINFAKLFYIEFLYKKKLKDQEDNFNSDFFSPIINFLELKKIPKNKIADILFPTFLIKILDSILVNYPSKYESKKYSNVDPKFYKFLDYNLDADAYDNNSGLNLKTILNKIQPKKNTSTFSHILNDSNKSNESDINTLGLDLIYELIQGYNESLKSLVLESGIFEACKILIEKNCLIELLELLEEIKLNDANNLKTHLFNEYHKIHFYRNNLDEKDFDYTTNDKADLLSKFIVNFEIENKIPSIDENYITVKLYDNKSSITVFESGIQVFHDSIDKGVTFFINQVKNKFEITQSQAKLLIDWYGLVEEDSDLFDIFTLKGVNLSQPKEIKESEYSEITCKILDEIIVGLVYNIPQKIIDQFEKDKEYFRDVYEHIILDTTNFPELRGHAGIYIDLGNLREFRSFKDNYKDNGNRLSIFDPACGSFNLSTSVSKLLYNKGNKSHINGFDIKSNSELLNTFFLRLISKKDISFASQCSLTSHIESEEIEFIFKYDDKYDLMVCDPPISYNWNHLKDNVIMDSFNDDSPYYYGIPDINDGEILFLQLMISKMHYNPKSPEELTDLINKSGMHDHEIDTHSRIGVFLKNDLLDSNRGNLPQIRSYIIENDLLDSVIKLPKKINDPRSIWILDNNKDQKRKGKINLIDLDKYNPKGEDILSDDYNSSLIEKINTGKAQDYSKVISNKEFGFYEIIVENENNECMTEKIEITSKLNDSIFIDIENKYPNAKVHREKIKIGYFINFDKYFS